MAKKRKVPQKFQQWIDARTKYHLSHAQIQMAREMGMNPKNFRKLTNHEHEKWKLPLGPFIEQCYLKRFGKLPDEIVTIEQRWKNEQQKKEARRLAKQKRREAENEGIPGDGDADPHEPDVAERA